MNALRLMSLCLLSLPVIAEQPDPYQTDDVRTLKVGQTLDVTPPGIVLQLVCDKVGELIEVETGETQILVKALAPGVTACSFYGQQDRDEYEDGQRSGVVEYRTLVKLVIEK